MSNNLVSVIVPVYNVEKHLKKCLNSILNQTFSNFECILIDDCSTDNSLEICKNFVQLDNRFKVITNTNNLGASLSRKVGFENSYGKYIQFIDSDDYIENTMIDKMFNLAESNNHDIVLCNFYDYYNNEIVIDKIYDKNQKIKEIVAIYSVCALWNKLVKREIITKITFPNTSHSEDRFISLQTIYYSNSFGHVNEPLYHYIYNDSSSTRKKINTKITIDHYKNYLFIIDFIKTNFTNYKFLEPELSYRINIIKRSIIKEKIPKEICDISKLYPESNFFRYLIREKIKKLYLILIPKTFQIKIKRLIKKECH